MAAVWIAGAWLAAAAHREGHAGHAVVTWAAAVALAALLTALQAVAAPGWSRSLAGLLWAVLSGALAVTAAALIRRAEPVSLAQARGRWRRAQGAPRRGGPHLARRCAERRHRQGKLAEPGPQRRRRAW